MYAFIDFQGLKVCSGRHRIVQNAEPTYHGIITFQSSAGFPSRAGAAFAMNRLARGT